MPTHHIKTGAIRQYLVTQEREIVSIALLWLFVAVVFVVIANVLITGF